MSEPPSGAAPVAYTDAAGVFPTIARGVEERRVIKDVSWSTRTAAGGGSGGGGSGSGTHTVPELPLRWLPDSHEAFRGTLTVEQWHRAPYAHVFLLAAETRDAYAAGPRAPLRAWIEDAVARGHEWLVLYLPGAGVAATRDAGAAARAYAKVEERVRGDMPARREASRVVRLDIAGGVGVEPRAQWAELLSRLLLCVSAALSARCVAYSEEVRRRWDVKDVPGWNFCGYFCVREALAFVYVQGQVPEEALRCVARAPACRGGCRRRVHAPAGTTMNWRSSLCPCARAAATRFRWGTRRFRSARSTPRACWRCRLL